MKISSGTYLKNLLSFHSLKKNQKLHITVHISTFSSVHRWRSLNY